MTEIYTDGSIYPNPGGEAGWAYVIVFEDSITVRCGYLSKSTSNRAEMNAVIHALRDINRTEVAIIYTDSEYTCRGINGRCIYWNSTGWRGHIKNKDLWKEMYAEAMNRGNVDVEWTRGHDNNIYNEFADRLANYARLAKANSKKTFPKTEFEANYKKLKKSVNRILKDNRKINAKLSS